MSHGPDSTGNPLAGTKILDLPAYGSGPLHRAAGPNGTCAWQGLENGNCMFGWRRFARALVGYRADEHELARHARPFLVFGLANGDFPRVVYLGRDGAYGGRNNDNPCLPPPGTDDYVLCLSGG